MLRKVENKGDDFRDYLCEKSQRRERFGVLLLRVLVRFRGDGFRWLAREQKEQSVIPRAGGDVKQEDSFRLCGRQALVKNLFFLLFLG